MEGTIPQNVMDNEVVPNAKIGTNSPTLMDRTSEENSSTDLTNTSIKCPSLPVENDAVSFGSESEKFLPGQQCSLECMNSSIVDANVSHGKVKETSQCLSVLETVKGNASHTEEGGDYSSSEVKGIKDKRYPSKIETENMEWVARSSEDYPMAVTSIGHCTVSVEQEVSSMDSWKEQKIKSLDSSSTNKLLKEEKMCVVSSDAHQINRHLLHQQNVKETVTGEQNDNILTTTKSRESESSMEYLSLLNNTSPNEVNNKLSGHECSSLEYYQLENVSRKTQYLLGKEVSLEGNNEKIIDFNAKNSLQYRGVVATNSSDDSSTILSAVEPTVTSSTSEVEETKELSHQQEIVKKNVSVIEDYNEISSLVVMNGFGSDKHPQLQVELCSKEDGREHAGQSVSQDEFQYVATNTEKGL